MRPVPLNLTARRIGMPLKCKQVCMGMMMSNRPTPVPFTSFGGEWCGGEGDSAQEFHKSVMPVIAYQKCFYVLNKKIIEGLCCHW